jgi:hypothetical protein
MEKRLIREKTSRICNTEQDKSGYLVFLCKIVLFRLDRDGRELGPVLQSSLHQHDGVYLGIVPVALKKMA